MTTATLFVIDTHALIWYFQRAFRQPNKNSSFVNGLLDHSLTNEFSPIRIVVPSISLIEIFEKFCTCEQDARRVYYECFCVLNQSSNVDIRELDWETMQYLIRLDSVLESHEIHDKIIVATAQMLNCCLVTKDPKIWDYAGETKSLAIKW